MPQTTIRADLAGGVEARTSRSRFGRRFGVLLFALVVVRGVVLMCVLPPFEGWDEYQHVAYVQHLRDAGRAPVAGQAVVSPALLAEAVKFPHPESAVRDLLGGVGAVGYGSFWALHQAHAAPNFRDLPVSLYQAQHGPLSYRVLQPAFSALGGVGSLRSSIAGMRLVNLLLTAGAVGLAVACLRRQLLRRRDAALIGLALATHPLFLLNGVRVANDALGVFLATLTVWLGLSLSSTAANLRRSRLTVAWLATGVLTGMAVLAKATNFALVPFAGFCVLMLAIRAKADLKRTLIAGAALALGFVAVMQSEIRFNLEHYGSLSAMQEAAVNHRRGLGPADFLKTAASIPWSKTITQLWDRRMFFAGGWSFLHSHPRAVGAYRDVVAIGLFGWAWGGLAWVAGRRRGGGRLFANPGAAPACAVLVASYTAALAYHMVQSKLAWGASSTGPWYASPALPWFLTLVIVGGLRWPLGDRLRPALPLALVAASLAAEFIGLFGQMVPAYTGYASWTVAFARLSWLQPWWLGSPTLIAAAAVEVATLAALALVWRDDVRSERGGSAPRPRGLAPGDLRGGHAFEDLDLHLPRLG
ncbi:MAG: glycosyltransferase family 39 protein [Paludisphaera borealis]|uniref:glycosyltransferase family 39 protein n=1 Tax=Paludisphaera borealis TaxID=1387353 RepID=UPI0028477BD2|nr:glycosyltransferase family 39 protein [Paludisphaera borealis]MDR3622583.1 glycosyltransferase family 39 protein [Paludisphaera borealis]